MFSSDSKDTHGVRNIESTNLPVTAAFIIYFITVDFIVQFYNAIQSRWVRA